MRFVKTATAEKPHILSSWDGLVMWMVCGQIVDMGRQSVKITESKVAPDICGVCAAVEARNAYIPGASR